MTPAPVVSIVTPSYNQGQFIRATIESVLAQTYSRIEYIVIDGGSTDDTLAILREFEDRLTWVSEPDRGQAHAINKGFQRASGQIVAWLNSDDLLAPQAAALAAAEFADHPTAGFVYGDAYMTDEDGHLQRIVKAPEPNPWRLANVVDYVSQPAAFFRRGALLDVGWIDESWHWLMDWDVFMRLSLAFPSVRIPAVMAYARIHDAAKTSSGGVARFAEIDRFIRTYSARRLPPAFRRYALESCLLAAGWWFRRLTSRVGVDPTVPGLILESAMSRSDTRPARTGVRSPLHARLEHRSRGGPLKRMQWLAAHPVRTLHPDARALRRRHAVRRVRTQTFWGEKMTVVVPDAVSEQLLRLGYFDPAVSSFFIRWLRPGMTVLDVGAHIGYFSLLAARCVGDGGAVRAFEPTPSTAQILRSNVAARPQVSVVEAAVWRDSDGAELNDYGEPLRAYNSMRDVLLPAVSGVPRERVAVSSLTLDSYCAQAGLRPDLVTIDAPGSEREILDGMATLIDEVRPALVLGVDDLQVSEGPSGAELVEHLLARGYKAFDPLVGMLCAHAARTHYALANLVFLP